MQRARPYDRDEALDAALGLFWEKGYHATSLKDLEAVLRMKPGSIYAAFTSKEKLFLLTLERYYERSREEFRSVVTEAHGPMAGLKAFLKAVASAEIRNPKHRACMLVKTLLTTTTEDAEITRTVDSYLEGMAQEMAHVFEQAKAAGEIRADLDPRRLARRFQSDLSALKIEAYRDAPAEELARRADELAQDLDDLRPAPH